MPFLADRPITPGDPWRCVAVLEGPRTVSAVRRVEEEGETGARIVSGARRINGADMETFFSRGELSLRQGTSADPKSRKLATCAMKIKGRFVRFSYSPGL